MADQIEGGYILLARKLFDSELMSKPPLYLKLWVWMLVKANWKDRDKLKRGQFVASIADMQDAMSYHIGYRKMTPTKDEIRSAYEAFTKAAMITTTKTTRGLLVTILNYEQYQNPSNYEAHNETHDEISTKPTITPHHTEEREERRKKEKKHTVPSRDDAGVSSGKVEVSGVMMTAEQAELFAEFWQTYPKERRTGKGAVVKAWMKIGVDALLSAKMVQALEKLKLTEQWNRDGGKYIPMPTTWLNQRRWEDDIPEAPGGDGSWKTGIFAGVI